LVSFDAQGEIEPALAERWIVEDGGKSYIFRLRNATWPDGDPITAEEVARILTERVRANRRAEMKADLEAVLEILAMTGEVIEIRLSAPRPSFLQILAQPRMGISGRNGGGGPYRREARGKAWMLTPVRDEIDGLDPQPLPRRANRVLRAERMAMGIVRFVRGDAGLVLGGRYSNLPLLRFADVDSKAVRLDPVRGLFGLAIRREKGFLADAANREALSMAIERERLPSIFSLAGWAVTSSILADPVDLGQPPAVPRWAGLQMEERRTLARNVVSAWKRRNGPIAPLRVALPAGPGSNLLFGILTSDFGRIGVPVVRVTDDEDADLSLIDEVAPYDSALWFLGRISCTAEISCSAEAAQRLAEAQQAQSPEIMLRKLSEADVLTLAHGGYIPLAVPLRWSLVSRRLRGFQPSPRAFHPLNHLLPEPR
jgi:oligopeptide transport system substrate-binding protein